MLEDNNKNQYSNARTVAVSLILIFTSFISISHYYSVNKVSTQDEEIKNESYEIFKLLMQGNTTDTFCVKKSSLYSLNYHSLGLSADDSVFMERQMNDQVIFKKLASKAKEIIFLPTDPIRQSTGYTNKKDTIFNKYGLRRVPNSFSPPIFSIDLKQAIQSISNHWCPRCGEGAVLFLKKENNKWKVDRVIEEWVE